MTAEEVVKSLQGYSKAPVASDIEVRCQSGCCLLSYRWTLPLTKREEQHKYEGCNQALSLSDAGPLLQEPATQESFTAASALSGMQVWRSSSFQQRKVFLTLLLRYIIDHQEDICRYIHGMGGEHTYVPQTD